MMAHTFGAASITRAVYALQMFGPSGNGESRRRNHARVSFDSMTIKTLNSPGDDKAKLGNAKL